MRKTSYDDKYQLKKDLNNLDEKINNIGDDNTVSDSKIKGIDNYIQTIEERIKNTKRDNRMKVCIKGIKIFGRALQGVFPYVVVASIVFGLQTAIYDVPFYRQKEFYITQHEEIIDSSGIIDDKETYISQSTKIQNGAYYSTKWEQKEDGKYYRTIKEYNIGNYTLEELREFVNNPDLNIEEVFGSNYNTKYEVKDEITDKEREEKTGLKIVYRYKDDEDIILAAQDFSDNALYSMLYILFSLLASLLVVTWRVEGSDYDFMEHVRRIKRQNQKVDVEELERLFEEKKITFERVYHPQVSLVDPDTQERIYIKK